MFIAPHISKSFFHAAFLDTINLLNLTLSTHDGSIQIIRLCLKIILVFFSRWFLSFLLSFFAIFCTCSSNFRLMWYGIIPQRRKKISYSILKCIIINTEHTSVSSSSFDWWSEGKFIASCSVNISSWKIKFPLSSYFTLYIL